LGVGRFSSLALDVSDNPHISYHDYVIDALKYAWISDEYFWSANTVTVDTTSDGYNNSVLVTMDVDTTHTSALNVTVNAFLTDSNGAMASTVTDTTWSITSNWVEYGTLQLYTFPGSTPDWHTITLELWDAEGNYEQRYNVTQPVYLYPPDMQTGANVTLDLSATTLYLGYTSTVTGTAIAHGEAIPNLPLILQYSVTGGVFWESLTAVTTDSEGRYSAVWLPPATGHYRLRAVHAATEVPMSDSAVLEVLPSEDGGANLAVLAAQGYTFSVVSNSTLSALTYDSAVKHLACTVSGPSNTTGYVAATVAASLVPDIASLRVLLDGADVSFEALRIDDAWLLYATYPHSVHVLQIQLGLSARYAVEVAGDAFTVATSSNSTIGNVAVNLAAKALQFTVAGAAHTAGWCNVTVEHALLGGPYAVLLDDAPVAAVDTANATHTWLYFTYTHSVHDVTIIGTTVIPDVPSMLATLLLLSTATIATMWTRRRR
jgi:hypothetical protein